MKKLSITTYQLDFTYQNDKKWKETFHSHTQYELYYFHGGRCNFLIGDRMYVLEPGDLIIMNGLTLHRPKTFEGEPYIRSVIHFDAAYFATMLSALGMEELLNPFRKLQSYRLRLEGETKDSVESKLEAMHQWSYRTDIGSDFRYRLAFLDLLAIIYGLLETPLEQHSSLPSEKENHVQNIVSFIERHYMEDIHMQSLEQALHLSKYYLAKVFKEITGATIFDYLYQRRINQAKIEFLLHPERSVTEVGYNVGFKHLAHFSKVFKQLAGCSPDQFRKTSARELMDWTKPQ